VKVLFICYAVGSEKNDKERLVNPSGNKYQLNLIECLNDKLSRNLDIISIPGNPYFPLSSHFYIPGAVVSIVPGVLARSIGFINLPVLKNLLQSVAVFMYTFKWLVVNRREAQRIILTFNSNVNTVLPSILLRLFCRVKIISYVTDPPYFLEKSKNTYDVLKRIYLDISKVLMRNVDGMVVISKHIVDVFKITAPYLVVDNGYSENVYADIDVMVKDKTIKNKIVMFAGSLSVHNGIVELVEAFNLLSAENIELWIYGEAELKDYVIDSAQRNPKIKYMGVLGSKKILEVYSCADLLINTRNPYREVSDCTFPSKMTEYLVSGTPVLTTRLKCYGPEYDELFYFIDDFTSNGISQKILEILMLPAEEICLRKKTVIKFMLDNKTWSRQIDKVIDFLAIV